MKYPFKKFHTRQNRVGADNRFLKIGNKSLGSGVKTRVGRVTRTTHIFLFGLIHVFTFCTCIYILSTIQNASTGTCISTYPVCTIHKHSLVFWGLLSTTNCLQN
jgi:hypothetical protein